MTAEGIRKIIKDKVEGVWRADHDAFGHWYVNTKTGTRVASITTKQKIIKKAHLDAWIVKKGIEWIEQGDRFSKLSGPERNLMMIGAQEAHKEESGDAADAGTLAHAVIENYLNYWIGTGDPPDDIKKGFKEDADPRSIAGARAAERLFKEKGAVPIATELLVGEEGLMNSAGTLDCLVLVDGELEIWDWKLTNAIEDGYAAQASSYAKMFEKMTGLKIARIKVYQLSKKCDKFTPYKVAAPVFAYKAMVGLSQYYDFLYGNKPRIEKDVIKINLTTDYGRKKFGAISGTQDTGTRDQGADRGDTAGTE